MLAIVASLFFSACSSDDDKDPRTQSQANPTPDVPGDANAVLAAIKVNSNVPGGVSVPGLSGIAIDVASASFFEGNVGGSLVSVGEVKLNSKALTVPGGNAYISDPTDFSYEIVSGQDNSWEVAGGSGFDAFSHTTSTKMPDQVLFASSVAESFSKSGDVTVSIASVPSNCQNILWVFSDGNTVVTKESKTTSVTFSSSDLSGIKATSTGILQVAAYNYESATYGGKKVYFINETVDSKYIEIN